MYTYVKRMIRFQASPFYYFLKTAFLNCVIEFIGIRLRVNLFTTTLKNDCFTLIYTATLQHMQNKLEK